jgi:predicted CXXCH cytochrome family protein
MSERPRRSPVPPASASSSSFRWLILVALVVAASGAAAWMALGPMSGERASPGADNASIPAYVDERLCANCHASEWSAWQSSHHDLAMQEAAPETVLGDFGDVLFTHFGRSSRFFTRDGDFFVNTEGPDGVAADFEVAYTFGVEPLQQYLLALPGGRMQAFQVAWDTVGKAWFHLSSDAEIGPGEPFHWTGAYQNWNLMCASCHSTDLRKNYDSGSDTYQTSWSAIDVGCQACHGPGEAHVLRVEGGPDAGSDPTNGLVVDFRGQGPRYEVDQCAACHSRRFPVSAAHVPGEPLLDHFVPATLAEGLYYPDGQILDEVYVYGSFVQSRMYRQGVACTDCHDAHTLRLRAEGNRVCTGCHAADATPDRFPTLAPLAYDSPAHHFHEPATEGARCVSCHMPARTYMEVDPRRDHGFRVPRPDLSIATGSPNACNLCHADQTPEWAGAEIAARFPNIAPGGVHYGEILTAARSGLPDSLASLVDLIEDPDQPAIVRATAMELAGTFGESGMRMLAAQLGDPDPWLRWSALSQLDTLPPSERPGIVGPLLADPARAVRSEAARLLISVGLRPELPGFEPALSEYLALLESIADTPAGRVGRAQVAAANGGANAAISDYRAALRIDPDYLPAALNLATLYSQLGRNGDALPVLDAALERTPESGEAWYSRGLLLGEEGRFAEASDSLASAARLLPDRSRVRYNYGLALLQIGRRAEALEQLQAAAGLAPGSPDFVRALVIFYVQESRWPEALPHARELAALLRGDAEASRLLADIEGRAGRSP